MILIFVDFGFTTRGHLTVWCLSLLMPHRPSFVASWSLWAVKSNIVESVRICRQWSPPSVASSLIRMFSQTAPAHASCPREWWERHCNMSRMNCKVNRSRFKETPPSNAMKKFETLHIWDNFAMNFTSIIHSWPQRRAAHKGEWVVLIWYYRGDHERPAWHVTMMMGWISKSGLLSGLTLVTR